MHSNYRDRALLDLVYQVECTLQIDGVCAGGFGEPAHRNQSRHGKGGRSRRTIALWQRAAVHATVSWTKVGGSPAKRGRRSGSAGTSARCWPSGRWA